MTFGTQGNQVLFGVITTLAAKVLVVNLEIQTAPTDLASPAIAP
jgi:hypothetical protein